MDGNDLLGGQAVVLADIVQVRAAVTAVEDGNDNGLPNLCCLCSLFCTGRFDGSCQFIGIQQHGIIMDGDGTIGGHQFNDAGQTHGRKTSGKTADRPIDLGRDLLGKNDGHRTVAAETDVEFHFPRTFFILAASTPSFLSSSRIF